MINRLKLALLASGSVLLSACVTPTSSSMLVFPEPVDTQYLMTIKSASVVDTRTDKSLATINGEKTPANPNLEANLTNWLNKSIATNTRGYKHLEISLVNFSTYVMQGTMQFDAESVIEWQAKLTNLNDNGTWQKSYQRSLKQDGLLNLSKAEIEGHLNKLAHQLLQDTVTDPEFKNAVGKK